MEDELKVEDDFRDDDKVVEGFADKLPDYDQLKFRGVYSIIQKYKKRIDSLRSERNYHKAQIERRMLSEQAMTNKLSECEKLRLAYKASLTRLEKNRWVKLLRWLRLA